MTVSLTPAQLTSEGRRFLHDRYLASYTCLQPDGSPHVTLVGFTWDAETGVAWVITSGRSRKARNAAAGGPVVLCQYDGPRWMSLMGTSKLTDEPTEVAAAVDRYAQRYRVPRKNPQRVAIAIAVTELLGSATFFNR